LLSEAETGAELPLSHSPGLGGGEKGVSEGRADAGTRSEGSGTEPCTELESVIVIGLAHGRIPSRVSRDGPGVTLHKLRWEARREDACAGISQRAAYRRESRSLSCGDA
jgi:hypothetical protein